MKSRYILITGLLALLILALSACNTEGAASADIVIAKIADVSTIDAGQTLTYTITVDNEGPDAAENVVVTDTLDSNLSFISVSDDGCTQTNGVVTCELGDIANDDSITFTIQVTVEVDAAGTLTNTISVSADTDDPDDSNNSASTNTNVTGLSNSTWFERSGAADTICANGSAFKYFFNKGMSDNLVIDFEGGGACWDDASCLAGASSGGDQILYADFVASSTATLTAGIYDHSNDANPVEDWSHVFIPYCTGDLHIGNVSQTYTNPFNQEPYTIEHKGAVNTQSVLDWTFDTFEAPESIFITGCSAGGYGAAFWTDNIKANYPDVPVYQLGDCAVGASTDPFAALVEANWNTTATFPDRTFDKDFTNNVYIDTANKYPNSLNMAQYNTTFDQTQIGFYALITGQTEADPQQVAAEWSGIMQTSIATIDAATTNFNSFTALDTQHCIINSENFYTREENGVKLTDWLTDYLAGQSIDNVAPAAQAP